MAVNSPINISQGSKENFQRAIMEKGFYPEELPPCFEVSGFFEATEKLDLFQKTKIKKGEKGLELSQYNASKRGFQRRIFSCPNPLFHIRIASFLGEERGKISTYFRTKGRHYSYSIPQINPSNQSGHRAIIINTFGRFNKQKRIRLATYPYLVRLDTSRFYPSIYTHAIPWAYHGKSVAKSSSGKLPMDELDKIVRSAQRNQTIGIPIGPDTSRIVSEIIAVAVDKEFRRRTKGKVHGVRLVDDAIFGAESEAHAREILNAYRESLREFELDINETKTKIISSSEDLEPYWIFSIKRDFEQGIELANVLDHIIRITNEQNDEGIIKFAIQEIDKRNLWTEHWDIIEPFLMRVSVNFSHCLSYVVRVVIWALGSKDINKEININKWKKVCHLIIKEHAPLGHDSEVTWACWLLRNLPIKSKITKLLLTIILEKSSSFPALIAIDLAKGESNAMQQESIKLVEARLTEHPMRERDWLLSYEAERLFGHPLSTRNREDYSFFGEFIRDGVQFYNSERARAEIPHVKFAIKDSGSFYEDDNSEDDLLSDEYKNIDDDIPF